MFFMNCYFVFIQENFRFVIAGCNGPTGWPKTSRSRRPIKRPVAGRPPSSPEGRSTRHSTPTAAGSPDKGPSLPVSSQTAVLQRQQTAVPQGSHSDVAPSAQAAVPVSAPSRVHFRPGRQSVPAGLSVRAAPVLPVCAPAGAPPGVPQCSPTGVPLCSGTGLQQHPPAAVPHCTAARVPTGATPAVFQCAKTELQQCGASGVRERAAESVPQCAPAKLSECAATRVQDCATPILSVST